MPALRSHGGPGTAVGGHFGTAASRAPKVVGTEVMLSGLIGRKHLNGLTGVVVPHLDGSFMDETHRCRVQVHGSAQTVKVLQKNIQEVTAESSWEISNRIVVTERPPEDHLALPTAMSLNVDRECEVPVEKSSPLKFTNRVCTSKGQQLLGETYAELQSSAAGRDPVRLRHTGLNFFRDNLEEEVHPSKARIRTTRSKEIWMHTMKSGFDWRSDGLAMYTDPFHIPAEQGGHAARAGLDAAMNRDAAEGEVPLHPRLRGLLLNEDLEPEQKYKPVERGYRELLLFTDDHEFLKTRDVGGPLRGAAQKETEFKKKENNRSKLLKGRAALSVKPTEERKSPQLVQWSGAPMDDGTWDVMAWDKKNGLMEADAAEAFTLEHLLHRKPEQGYCWEASVHGNAHSDGPLAGGIGQRPWSEDAINEMLQKSVDEASDFDYGGQAGGSRTERLPWYEQGEFASSMLLTSAS